MVAAELNPSGRAKRYKTWEAALLWAMRGVEFQRHRADTEHRAREFARMEPEAARHILFELAEGASEIGDTEAMACYLALIADMQRWLDSCAEVRDPWDAEPDAPAESDDAAEAIAYLEANGYAVRKVKAAKVRRKRKEYVTLEPEELDALYRAVGRRGYTNARNRAIIGLMRYAGLRVGEACALRADAVKVDGDLAMIHVPNEAGAKTGARVVPLRIERDGNPTRAWADLQAYLSVRVDGPWLFTTQRGTQTDPYSVRRAVSGYAERAGIGKHVTPHVLRHTFGTALARAGVEPDAIRALMGHKDVATSAIYWHTDEKRMREVVSKL